MANARGKQAGPFMLFIMGVIFTAAGLAVIYFFGSDLNFTCKRSVDKCVMQETNVFGEEKITNTINLRKLAGAEVIEKRGSEGDYTYQVMLITNQGRIPFSNYSSSDYNSHHDNANKINNFVNSYEENLEIKQSGTFSKIFGFVFAGVGILLLLGSLGGLLKLIILLFVMLAKRK